MSSTQSHARSSLVNFFIYNTDYGKKEGTEEEKIMLYIPQEDGIGRKVNAVGICQALVQFVDTFNPCKKCECLVTQKSKQYFLNSESNFWMVMTLSVPYVEKNIKDKIVTDYYADDIQDPISNAVLEQSYKMFVLFNGKFEYIIANYGLPALKERLEFFYTRYLQTLNFGQLDLLDVYQGVLYLPLEKSDFLRVQCFTNLIENTFSSIRHTCIMHNEQLLWTTLKRDDLRILYKYLTTSLFPALFDPENDASVQVKNSPDTLKRSSPVTHSGSVPNPGKFLTGPIEMVNSTQILTKKAPRVFVDCEGSTIELHLLVYKAYNCILCLMVDLNTLTTEFCTKLHNFTGQQLGSLSSIISEHGSRYQASSDYQYRFVYFNSMNLAIKSSILNRRSLNLTGVLPDIMRLLVDMHKDLKKTSSGGEIIAKNLSDCWIVGKRYGSREFFVILNQKNASLVDINEEIQRLVTSSFSNILFLD